MLPKTHRNGWLGPNAVHSERRIEIAQSNPPFESALGERKITLEIARAPLPAPSPSVPPLPL